MQRQDSLALEDGALISKLLSSKRLLRLALAAADHPFPKHYPNGGDDRSGDDACRTCHRGDNGGVGHAALSMGFIVVFLPHHPARGRPQDNSDGVASRL